MFFSGEYAERERETAVRPIHSTQLRLCVRAPQMYPALARDKQRDCRTGTAPQYRAKKMQC
jgi:hypothetical protein